MINQFLNIDHKKQAKSICMMKISVLSISVMLSFFSLKAQVSDINNENQIPGFNFLEKIIGQWEGPVLSTTPAGSFDIWYVDFRPVSESQVSQYSNLDANTINYISFFVVKHDNQRKIAMRTEGVFMNKGCVTYEVLDSVNEAKGYYRFSDFQSGTKRAYTEFIFKGDKLSMQTFTNKFSKQETTTIHSRWEAKLADRTAASEATAHFGFPEPVVVKDFTDVFKNMNESIYFSFENDPYPSHPQPYVGSVTVDIKIDDNLKIKPNHELFIVLSTESIFEGLKYIPENLKYFSKYAFLSPDTKSFTFTNVHPGTYYLYSYNDVNGDKKHKKGDYMSSDLNNIVEVKPETNTTVQTITDFIIP